MEFNNLKKIGLTEGEIKVYQALLELGETTKTALTKKSEVSPSKIYDITNRLARKGIISITKKQGIMNFKAADPKRLNDFMKDKEEEIESEKDVVKEILPFLTTMYQKNQGEGEVEVDVFHGWEGLKTAFISLENSMKKGDESLVFGASIGKSPEKADIFFRRHQQRIEKIGYRVRIIFNEDMKKRDERKSYYESHKLHRIKYLHQTTFTESYIYKNSILFVMLFENPISIKIKSKDAVESFKQFFETMWKQAKR
tara:strand:+ start:1261 stop:2025 length:765 start_codon:yes stop_codon:yes gene_type:complete